MNCKDLVELVTDYMEGALADDERVRFEEHADACDDCMEHLDQMRLTVRAVGRLRSEDISPEARDALLARFRGRQTGG